MRSAHDSTPCNEQGGGLRLAAFILRRSKISHGDLMLIGLDLPITVRASLPISDDDLLVRPQSNQLYRIKRNAKGELEILSPSGGKGSRCEARVIRQLDLWAEENGGAYFSSSAGFRMPDGSVLSPGRWNALSDRERHGMVSGWLECGLTARAFWG
jgi:hypothetical protein